MAKIAFTKLDLKKDNSIKEIEWNKQKIEVKQFLPTEEKLNLISRIINFSTDENAFYNPCKVEIFEVTEILLTYTNINITEKQGEDVLKLYDLFKSSGLKDKIYEIIPEDELKYIDTSTWATINEIYRYRDSAVGIMNSIAENYKKTDMDVNKIVEELTEEKENLTMLKDVVTKLN